MDSLEKFVCRNLFLIFNVICIIKSQEAHSVTVKVDVKPGRSVSEFKHEWKDTACTFSYSCMGGTDEEWEMTLSKPVGSDVYTCTVQRHESYLYFKSFTLTYTSKHHMTVHNAEAFAGNKPIVPEQYVIDHKHRKVSSSNAFKSELNKVTLSLTKGDKKGKKSKPKEEEKQKYKKQEKEL